MESKSLGLALVLAASGAVVVGGAWLALRPDAPLPAHAQVAAGEAHGAGDAAWPPGEPAGAIVHETEATIEEEEVEPAPAPEAAAPPASRETAAPRPAPARQAPAPRPAPAPAPEPEPAPREVVGLEGTWPSRAAERQEAREAAEAWADLPPQPLAPPPPLFEEVIVPADSVVGLQVETAVTTERAAVEDRVEARVTRDVRVGPDVAIPAGSRVLGSITLVEQGGKVRERARLGVRFHTIVLADGTELPIRTDTIYREGASPAGESTAKIGGAAVGGAIIGAILGGTKGAVMGGAAGAGAGTAATLAGDRNPATLPAGTTLTVRLGEPVVVEIER